MVGIYKMIKRLLILPLLVFMFTSFALAKEIRFEASVESNKVSVGQPFMLNLTFSGTQDIPALDMPTIEGFDMRYVGPSTRLSIINGQATSSITHVYSLVPLKVGTFKIGPLQFKYKTDTYTSQEITVEVVSGQVPSYAQQGQGQNPAAPVDINDRAFVVMEAKKNKVYLNEVMPLTIKLYVNRLALRDIQYPEFNHEGFSVANYGQPKQYQEMLNGAPYDVIEFDTTAFGIKSGDFHLGPAIIKCNLLVRRGSRGGGGPDDIFNQDFFDNFFGQFEARPLNLKSADIPVTVLPIPEQNKPDSYSGAVGYFDLDASVSPQEVKVGDPITLRIIVRGEGNFNTVSMPRLSSTKDFKIYEPQVKQEKNEKIFDEILLPMSSSIREVPQVAFSYFNTSEGKFDTLTKGPFSINVIKPEKEEEQKVVEGPQGISAPLKEEKFGRDIIYIKASSGKLFKKGDYLYNNKLFLGLQIMFLMIFGLILTLHRRKEKLRTDIQYARKLVAPRKAKEGLRQARVYLDKQEAKNFYDSVFSTLQEYLGDKFYLASQGITISVVDDILKDKKVPGNILETLREIFKNCDMARFAPSQIRREDMERTFKDLEMVIDYFQKNKV
ncbi:MAG: BatD family protein [Candidatus Omnitrophica bacterium]|nr:BatD family protein [Candidatus Omnitrophota bacterium]